MGFGDLLFNFCSIDRLHDAFYFISEDGHLHQDEALLMLNSSFDHLQKLVLLYVITSTSLLRMYAIYFRYYLLTICQLLLYWITFNFCKVYHSLRIDIKVLRYFRFFKHIIKHLLSYTTNDLKFQNIFTFPSVKYFPIDFV